MGNPDAIEKRASFAEFVAFRQGALVRLGWALTGDRDLGEDLAQSALNRLWKRWDSISESGDPWPYVRRIAVSIAATGRRRRWLSEVPTHALPDSPGRRDDFDAADMRSVVATWLSNLPARQRAVVTLRFLCDLSTDETAETLRCSPGTVKSQTAKALGRLRAVAILEDSPQGLHHE